MVVSLHEACGMFSGMITALGWIPRFRHVFTGGETPPWRGRETPQGRGDMFAEGGWIPRVPKDQETWPEIFIWVHALPLKGVDCVTKLNHTKSAVNFNLSTLSRLSQGGEAPPRRGRETPQGRRDVFAERGCLPGPKGLITKNEIHEQKVFVRGPCRCLFCH